MVNGIEKYLFQHKLVTFNIRDTKPYVKQKKNRRIHASVRLVHVLFGCTLFGIK